MEKNLPLVLTLRSKFQKQVGDFVAFSQFLNFKYLLKLVKTSSVHEWDYQDDSYPSLASDPCCFQVSLPSTSWEPTMLKFHFFLSQDITMVLKKQKIKLDSVLTNISHKFLLYTYCATHHIGLRISNSEISRIFHEFGNQITTSLGCITFHVKFVFSQKATKIDEILSIFLAFLENMNFKNSLIH